MKPCPCRFDLTTVICGECLITCSWCACCVYIKKNPPSAWIKDVSNVLGAEPGWHCNEVDVVARWKLSAKWRWEMSCISHKITLTWLTAVSVTSYEKYSLTVCCCTAYTDILHADSWTPGRKEKILEVNYRDRIGMQLGRRRTLWRFFKIQIPSFCCSVLVVI